MRDTFVHLHVASGYSMQYGASTPATLVQRAVAWGQPALALTDRDGLYGAVRFVQACTEAGIAPILGVDLAVRHPVPDLHGRGPAARPRTPVRGGAVVDARLPRVTVLARGQHVGLDPGAGWGRLCRLVTRTHLSGERGDPTSTPELIAELATAPGRDPADGAPSPLLVLLGPDSDVGRAVLARRRDQAQAALARWRALLPRDAIAIEVVCHGGPEGTPASLGHAARLYSLAREHGIRVVLTAAVRHADPNEAATVDVLDAARRLVALDVRHLDRVTTAGHLSPTPAMYAVACDILQASGPGISGGGTAARAGARALLESTVELAMECVQDAATDLGIGSVHLPEQTVLGIAPDEDPQVVLAERCRAAVATCYPGRSPSELSAVEVRLRDELEVIGGLGYPTYFLTVATVVDLIKEMGVRVAARGSGAGSLVNYLLGISGVDPMRYGLLMERFCSPLRAQLPDIDIDVESARRTEIYEKVIARFGGERVTCVSMMDSYRVRHAIRDVGAALGMPPSEVDAMAKAFPHISARNVRHAIADLPELRASGLNAPRLDLMLDLVERLDGLPRHIALHPCGVVLSNSQLLDRTPVESSWIGFPMSQFDKDDVESLGLLKLDILGIRMQSAMAHAVDEVRRVEEVSIDLDDRAQVALDDEATFRLIRTTHTLGCFQIESPGQRELIGKFGPETFEDLITDISLFRPGPVKSDMIVPFLNARQGWKEPEFLHPTLIPALRETEGVVVFHEQVLLIVAETTGVSLAQADEVRRALGSPRGQAEIEAWWRPAARARGYAPADVERIWEVLKAFASFGFCKAHAAAFALPTYQSAWLKTHHPAAFLAGVLTHDPGMYPKRLILDDARTLGIAILGLDVNASTGEYTVEKVEPWAEPPPRILDQLGPYGEGVVSEGVVSGVVLSEGVVSEGVVSGGDRSDGVRSEGTSSVGTGPDPRSAPLHPDLPDGRAFGIRLSLADVKGINDAEVSRIVAGQPYFSLADFWNRAHVSRPVVERLVLAGGFDSVYGIGSVMAATLGAGLPGAVRSAPGAGLGRRGRITRRDLLLHVAEIDRWSRSVRSGPSRSSRGSSRRGGPSRSSRGSSSYGAGAASGRQGLMTGTGRESDSDRVEPGQPGGHAGPPGRKPEWSGSEPGPGGHAGPPGRKPEWSGSESGPGGHAGPPGRRPEWSGSESGRPGDGPTWARRGAGHGDVAALAAAHSQAAQAVLPAESQPTQLTLDLGDAPQLERGSGLPEMTGPERVRAELDILGLDASAHIVDFYGPMLEALGVVRSKDLLQARSRREVWVAGVKVATQTPPVRSGRRVVFLTLDDATGPVDATFFEDAQGPYAGTVFHSWMLLVRGIVRRTGPRGISVRATGAWELSGLWEAWTRGGLDAVLVALEAADREAIDRNEGALAAAELADGRSVPAASGSGGGGREAGGDREGDGGHTDIGLGGVGGHGRAGGMGGGTGTPRTRRVLVHASGFKQSPYADTKPAGGDVRAARELAGGATVPDAVAGANHEGIGSDERDLATPSRKLWHSSPGSSGH